MLFTETERVFADAIRRLAYANPFDEDEQAAVRHELAGIDLGQAEAEQQRPPIDAPLEFPFADEYVRRNEALLLKLQSRLRVQKSELRPDERERFEDLIISTVYLRHFSSGNLIKAAGDGTERLPQFRQLRDDMRQWTDVPLTFSEFYTRPEHTFAVFFQYRLAVSLLEGLIQGESRPVMRLRAAIWHSIFPRELRLYGNLLYERMHEVTTLILGPSGTGKELVATAIGLARFVPFDPKRERFVEPFAGAFHPINLSATPRDLIESEMFGHISGAFTGATKDREGWFEKCKRGHTVFLDELGELAAPVQVRLLRVLQNREFYRVGDAEPRKFEGRVVAATNRDLSELIAASLFREDLYFRLCSDVIHTPTLREQLDASPDELAPLVAHVAKRCLGAKAQTEFVERLTRSTLEWIERSPSMGHAFGWPGNFRELEQCVRSVMVRGEYHPQPRHQIVRPSRATDQSASEPSHLDRVVAEFRAGSLTLDEMQVRYCSLVHAQTGNMAETARRLKKHRVTVQGRIESQWVERFQSK
ncbi:MAG: sigma-54-dependent Fis family transcriptional regulator [Rhodopirellula sp.]|nr:sigma-54-dependent Fis family transcriptional regulator [Rhodopirellula sp.]